MFLKMLLTFSSDLMMVMLNSKSGFSNTKASAKMEPAFIY